ncbi:MAG: tannase/feruloyl esterase family alpha/beta hydrolase [Microcystis aeruginosa Ma_AC_P_19900807_S299]|nr:MAG: tannase/feruloyl esterase family alpha/beta hydrolase [Microcystis aeruginosa Ma_AC_P_19900807_S299]
MKLNANHIGWMCLIAPLALSGCKVGGGGSGDSEAAPVARSCDSLNAMTIAAEDIGLPTRGAHVLAAEVQVAGETTPEFCRVSVQIEPFDPAALPINVQVNLPQTWNGKALHIGGGGYNGVLITGEDTLVGSASYPAPLVEGYATFGSDGGNAVNNAFGAEEHVQNFLNDEVVANYFGDQLKKTHDVAIALITDRHAKDAQGIRRMRRRLTQRGQIASIGQRVVLPASKGQHPVTDLVGRVFRSLHTAYSATHNHSTDFHRRSIGRCITHATTHVRVK